MSAEANVMIQATVTGLGPQAEIAHRFTDENTPEKVYKGYNVVATTATLISALTNIQSSEVLGMMIKAEADDIYVNTVSANVSLAGMFVPEGQAMFASFEPGNTGVLTVLGNAATAAMSWIIYGAAT